MMSNSKMIVTEESWAKIPETEKSWMIYNTLMDLQNRVKKIESRKWWDGAKIFAGGIIGGAAAAIGIQIGGIGK